MSQQLVSPDAAVETAIAQYPSVEFPPTPPFRLRLPEGWRTVPATQAEMVVVAPHGHSRYTTNVVVLARRVPPSTRADKLLADAIRREFARPGYELVESVADPRPVTPAHATIVRFLLRDSTLVEAHQLHVYVPSSPCAAHVVTATGTISAIAPLAEREEIQRVVRSLQLPLGRVDQSAAHTA